MRLVGPPLEPVPFATVNEALQRAAETSLGITFLNAHEEESVLPYFELSRLARRVAGSLLERGVEPGDRVALVLPTGVDFLAGFFGTLLAGAVPVPLYPPARLGRMDEYVSSTARMLSVVHARIVLTDRPIRLLLGRAMEQARPDLGSALVSDLVAEELDESVELEVEVEPDALALIQFSSGSTVDPKPVALTHRQLLSQCSMLKTLFPEVPGVRQVGVSWLPLYHDMGLIGCLLLAVFYPGPLVLIPPELFLAKPSLWLRAISKYKATISPAPNFAYGLCLKRVRDTELQGVELSSWHYALNGAEQISNEVSRQFCERFEPFGFRKNALMPVYGLSEAALAVTFTRSVDEKHVAHVNNEALATRGLATTGTRAIVSVGGPVPGTIVELRDTHGRALREQSRVGRVFVQSPSVMQGYFGNSKATARALTDGWLDTGDLGFVRDGELFLCGRAKDVIIIRGANHSPQSFEECLEGMPGVRAGCVCAVGWLPPGAEGEVLGLLVETTDAPPPDLASRIETTVLERTGIRPHTVALLAPGTLPRTSSGKLRRQEALKRFLAGMLFAPNAVNLLTVAREIARSTVGYAKTLIS